MTAKELLAEVSALGFDAPLSSNVAFISALNRSLRRIYGERRVTGTHSFFAIGRVPVIRYPYLRHASNGNETYRVAGNVFSCYAYGNGTLYVYSEDNAPDAYSFNGDGVRLVGKLGKGAYIKLTGVYSCYYTDFACYDDVNEINENIPDGSPTVKYDPRKLVGDFHSFIGSPTNDDGEPLHFIDCAGGILSVPAEYTGRISFRYLRLPPSVTSADMDLELELPEGCVEPLSLLVASYLYLDGDPKLAQHYADLYREAMERAPRPSGITYGYGYRDTNGWA